MWEWKNTWKVIFQTLFEWLISFIYCENPKSQNSTFSFRVYFFLNQGILYADEWHASFETLCFLFKTLKILP